MCDVLKYIMPNARMEEKNSQGKSLHHFTLVKKAILQTHVFSPVVLKAFFS